MTLGKKIIRSLGITFFLIPADWIIDFFTNDIPYLYEEAPGFQGSTRALDVLHAFSKWIIPNELYLWLLVFALAGISLAIVWLKTDLADKITRRLASPLTYLYLLIWLASFASLVRLSVVYSDDIDILLIIISGAYIDGIWKLRSKPFIRKAMLFFTYFFAMALFLSTRLFPDIGDHGFSPYPYIFGLPALFLYFLSLVVAIALYYGKHIIPEYKRIKAREADLLKVISKTIGMTGPLIWAIYILILTVNYELVWLYRAGFYAVIIVTLSTIIGFIGAANTNLKLLAVSLISILATAAWLAEDISKYLTIIVAPPMLIFLTSLITLYTSRFRNRKANSLSST